MRRSVVVVELRLVCVELRLRYRNWYVVLLLLNRRLNAVKVLYVLLRNVLHVLVLELVVLRVWVAFLLLVYRILDLRPVLHFAYHRVRSADIKRSVFLVPIVVSLVVTALSVRLDIHLWHQVLLRRDVFYPLEPYRVHDARSVSAASLRWSVQPVVFKRNGYVPDVPSICLVCPNG